MFKSNKFGRIFWVDDELEFKSCPLCVDGTGDFDVEDYVSDWTDWEGVDMNELLAIHKVCILNKTQYAGSLSLNDYAHKVTDKKDIVVDTFTEELDVKKYIKSQDLEGDISTVRDSDYADKVDTLVDKMGMTNYKFNEQFYNEIVKDSTFSYGKFNEINYPLHLQQQ